MQSSTVESVTEHLQMISLSSLSSRALIEKLPWTFDSSYAAIWPYSSQGMMVLYPHSKFKHCHSRIAACSRKIPEVSSGSIRLQEQILQIGHPPLQRNGIQVSLTPTRQESVHDKGVIYISCTTKSTTSRKYLVCCIQHRNRF